MNRIALWLSSGINYSLYFGLFVLVAGFFVRAENSKYHTLVYLGFYLPALAAVILNARTLAQDLIHDRALQIFTLFLAWLAVTLLWSPHFDSAHILKILLMLWLFVLALRIMLCDMRSFNFTLSISLCVGAVVISMALLEYLMATGSDIYRVRLQSIGERHISPVSLGQMSSILMMYCLMQARLTTSGIKRLGYVILSTVYLLPLILSFSRTAFMALFLTAAWYGYYKGHKRTMLALLALSLSLLVLMLTDINHELLTNISRPESLQVRFWGWVATWDLIQQNWLLGYGIGAPINLTPAETDLPIWHPHNLFLSIWYESGLVGLTLFMVLLGVITSRLRPLMQQAPVRYWATIFVLIILNTLVDSPPLVGRPAEAWLWFWLPLAVVMNADKLVAPTPPPIRRVSSPGVQSAPC